MFHRLEPTFEVGTMSRLQTARSHLWGQRAQQNNRSLTRQAVVRGSVKESAYAGCDAPTFMFTAQSHGNLDALAFLPGLPERQIELLSVLSPAGGGFSTKEKHLTPQCHGP